MFLGKQNQGRRAGGSHFIASHVACSLLGANAVRNSSTLSEKGKEKKKDFDV